MENILTLDLSTKSSGYAIGTSKKLINYGCITSSSKNVVKRITIMRDNISELLKIYDIKKIIMEEVRPEYNSHTNKVLMWLQAAIVIAAYEIDPKIECEFIGASTWRATLKMKQGRGIKRDNLKSQDINYVFDKYGYKVNDDEADAICLFDAYWIKQQDNNEINWG